MTADAAQDQIALRLDQLAAQLGEERRIAPRPFLAFLGQRIVSAGAPRGVYIWGAVGRGKTMLMDLFFETVPLKRKRRVHFHAFMADVHARIHVWRQARLRGEVKGDDPIKPVAEALSAGTRLLCFDEFVVTDIADAMILSRLFTALFERDVVVVATSNVPPHQLYRDGLNRALFLPFIAEIEAHMDVLELDAARDFRLQRLASENIWIVPADGAARQLLDGLFADLAMGMAAGPREIAVLGRLLHVPLAAGQVARFSFEALCEAPLGPTDYLALAREFHSLIIDDVPRLAADNHNAARRFILLIDTLYDAHVKLAASAAAEPGELYRAATGTEAFEFARTVSRLAEMRGLDYLALPHGRGDSLASGSSAGLVET
ncbi:MAG: AFG1 family ATPase [Hyphomicrobiales bacterium]|nr:AFG1 family ATPase [Hyphomicrobiales bacterium]